MTTTINLPSDFDVDNIDFQNVLRLITETNDSIYMTGRAGTGKSTFLRYIVGTTKKKTVVLAPTGIAAVNVGGVTLHSFFNIPRQPLTPDDPNLTNPRYLKERLKYNNDKMKLLRNIELIVIDEISMVRADVLDFVDLVLRTFTKSREPFGGKQLLLVGDAFQLEPVIKREEWDILRRFYQTPYFFGARIFQHVSLIQIELQKVYRQHDIDFLAMLDRVRNGAVNTTDMQTINSRVQRDFEPGDDDFYITLTTTNASADVTNEKHLDELPYEPKTFTADVFGDFPETLYPTNHELVLKPGAQVVFIKNDMEKRWYNGSIARVVDYEDEGIWVESQEGDTHFVKREIWHNIRYKYNEEKRTVEEETLGSFTQFPLKLAWAITIHKSQGLTFDRAIIDFGAGAFACGQAYVALSRCRTLGGMVLKTPMTQRDVRTNDFVSRFAQAANDKMLINKALLDARAKQHYIRASVAFHAHNFTEAVDNLAAALDIRRDDFKRDSFRRLIARKLNIINQLERDIKRMAKEQKQREKEVKEFAHEYFLMAVESFHKYAESTAALANVNKCLKLNSKNLDALQLKAEILSSGGDYEGAIDCLDKAIKLAHRNHALYKQRADLHMLTRNFDHAYNDYLSSIRHGNEDTDVYRELAKACRHLGLDNEADRFDALSDQLDNLDD